MSMFVSDQMRSVDLRTVWTHPREALGDGFELPPEIVAADDVRGYRGVPFDLRRGDGGGAILLEDAPVTVPLDGEAARWLLVLHVAESLPTILQPDPETHRINGNRHGDPVSVYSVRMADGATVAVPITRRFEIQQGSLSWGASPFAAQPYRWPRIKRSAAESAGVGQAVAVSPGNLECRHWSGREDSGGQPHLWVYALPLGDDARPVSVELAPDGQRSAIVGLALSTLTEHPLRDWPRRKARLPLPPGEEVDVSMEYTHLAIDLGVVITARPMLRYDHSRWTPELPDVQPERLLDQVIVEYAAHPQARIRIGQGDAAPIVPLADLTPVGGAEVAPAHRPVRLRVLDATTRQQVGVRLHIHGADGEYLPPKGHHRWVNQGWFEDYYGEHQSGLNQYAYIDGETIVDLPLGQVFVDISRGFEIPPIRQAVTVTAETDELVFQVERQLDWYARGWVTADTHVHFLSPTTARLEGEAEDVNVVNLLASQWGEMFSNVGDFDGRKTHGATESGGDGQFLVRVGTENRMQVLGHISLLGYEGPMIHPLCSGGPSESAIGDFLEVSMGQWAQRCRDQKGLVVMPHAPNPQCERAADIVLGLVDAIEIMAFNGFMGSLDPASFADWYRWLDLGYHIPLVAGSDKMAASSLLGGVRTYVHMGDRPFTYENWMTAIREGHSFVSTGPLIEFHVEGHPAGRTLELPAGGGTLNVSWRVASVRLPIEAVELVVGGETVERLEADGALSHEGSVEVKVQASTWLALRVRGSHRGVPGQIAAHSSAVVARVDAQPIFSALAAGTVLQQIEGAMAYVDTLAAQPDAQRLRAIRTDLRTAWNRLHSRLHSSGVFHQHTPHHHHPEHDA